MRLLRSCLQHIEFVDLSFHYRLDSPKILPDFPELFLRASLHRSGIERLEPLAFERLFTPALPDDTTALRRYQRPAPPFAFQPQTINAAASATDRGIISCRLFGDGIMFADDLISAMEGIKPYIFSHNQRDGQLIRVSANNAAGEEVTIWNQGMSFSSNPPRNTAAWSLDNEVNGKDNWRIDILTPARLLVQKKPLFHPYLRHLLPFILRRVTANCYFYNHIEIDDAQELLSSIAGIGQERSHLSWKDWREHCCEGTTTELGGVYGSLNFCGEISEDLLILLRLGCLMNIGKGAAFGAGAMRLTDNPEILKKW